MKKFEYPVIEVEELEVADVITTSGDATCATYVKDENNACPFD